jgi:hypothetical protein
MVDDVLREDLGAREGKTISEEGAMRTFFSEPKYQQKQSMSCNCKSACKIGAPWERVTQTRNVKRPQHQVAVPTLLERSSIAFSTILSCSSTVAQKENFATISSPLSIISSITFQALLFFFLGIRKFELTRSAPFPQLGHRSMLISGTPLVRGILITSLHYKSGSLAFRNSNSSAESEAGSSHSFCCRHLKVVSSILP